MQFANIIARSIDMKYIDRNKLNIELVKRGISKKQLANDMCITYSALYNKLVYMRDFSETEICILKKMFGDEIFSC